MIGDAGGIEVRECVGVLRHETHRLIDITGLQRPDDGRMGTRDVRQVELLVVPKGHDLVNAQVEPRPELCQKVVIG